MIVKIRKYIAKVAEFKEQEDGSISKEVYEIALEGSRFRPNAVLRKIPREAKLLESGWRETVYKVDDGKLEMFLKDHGEALTAENV